MHWLMIDCTEDPSHNHSWNASPKRKDRAYLKTSIKEIVRVTKEPNQWPTKLLDRVLLANGDIRCKGVCPEMPEISS